MDQFLVMLRYKEENKGLDRYMIYYLWNMKPGETKLPNKKIMEHNSKYIPHSRVLGPDDILPLVSKFSTELAELWTKIPHWIIKCDLGRLLYIYYNGGMYLDCDCVMLKHIQPTSPVVLFIEKRVSIYQLGPKEKKYGLRIANYAFASEAGHPFLKEVITECIRRLKLLKGSTNSDILWVCGPDVITTVYHETRLKDITLMDTTYLEHLMAGSWH
jgi:mannosyltransferase OCH1-like enzyme